MDLNKLQKEIYQNKVKRGFNVTDIGKEIVLVNVGRHDEVCWITSENLTQN